MKISSGWRWYLIGLSILLVCSILAIFVSAIYPDDVRTNEPAREVIEVDADYPGYTVTENNIQAYAGVVRTVVFPCPQLGNESALLSVILAHQYADIYIGDDLVYSKSDPLGPDKVRSPGYYLATVSISPDDAGKTIRIVTVPVYDCVTGVMPEVVIGDSGKVLDYYMRKNGAEYITAFMCVVLGIIYCIIVLISNLSGRSRTAVEYLGLFAILFGIYRITQLALTVVLADAVGITWNARFAYDTGYVLFGVACLVAIRFFAWTTDRTHVLQWLSVIELAILIVILVLHLTGIRAFRESLTFMTVNLIAFAFVVFISSFRWMLGHRYKDPNYWMQFTFLLIPLAALADVISYYLHDRDQVSCYTLMILFVYCVIRGISEVRYAIRQKDLLRETEIELSDQRVMTLMSQIRPHFIYNTLNTIYGLCDRDPAEAKRAIHDLSSYLRWNFDFVNTKGTIDFSDELEHAEFYLSIQKMRFGDDLSINYEIGCTDFMIPPLSVQTLVENAVMHGLRRRTGPGTVTIRTYRANQEICIEVDDDGVGFNTAILDGPAASDDSSSHLGIRNVKERLKYMCDGSLEITSEPGKGTRALITIPGEADVDEDNDSR